jgi:hypothetical protein
LRRPFLTPPAQILVFSGAGSVNGVAVDACAADRRELLVAPGSALKLQSRGAEPLTLYLFFPLTQ